MTVERLTSVGALLADETRVRLLVALMDGRARTGGELAVLTEVAPSTASEHLSRLLDAGMVAVDAQGRHRYFRLSGRETARMLESLGASGPGPSRSRRPVELAYARSCYDHLAGELAVRIYDALLAGGHLRLVDQQPSLTRLGEAFLTDLGVDVTGLHAGTRPVARVCLDWTERRHHLAGAAGAALFDALLAKRWLARGQRPRHVRITRTGHAAIDSWAP